MGMKISKDRKLVFNGDKPGGSVAGTGPQKPVVDQLPHFFGPINIPARTSKRTAAATSSPLPTPAPDDTAPPVKSNVAPRRDALTLKDFLGRSDSMKRLYEEAKGDPELLKRVSDLDRKQAELDARWKKVSKLARGDATEPAERPFESAATAKKGKAIATSQPGEEPDAAGALAPGARYVAGSYPDVTNPADAAMISHLIRQTNPHFKRNATPALPLMSRAGLQSGGGAFANEQGLSGSGWVSTVNSTKPGELHPAFRADSSSAQAAHQGNIASESARLPSQPAEAARAAPQPPKIEATTSKSARQIAKDAMDVLRIMRRRPLGSAVGLAMDLRDMVSRGPGGLHEADPHKALDVLQDPEQAKSLNTPPIYVRRSEVTGVNQDAFELGSRYAIEGKRILLSKELDKSCRYLWVMTAPNAPGDPPGIHIGFEYPEKDGKGKMDKLGHPSILNKSLGLGGKHEAIFAGELMYENGGWVIDNNSGRWFGSNAAQLKKLNLHKRDLFAATAHYINEMSDLDIRHAKQFSRNPLRFVEQLIGVHQPKAVSLRQSVPGFSTSSAVIDT